MVDQSDVDTFVGDGVLRRQIHVADLEERSPLETELEVARRRRDQPVFQARPQGGVVRRQRLRQLDSSGRGLARHQARGLDLGVAGADEDGLDRATKTLRTGQLADGLTTQRQRERHVVEPEACDLLDEIDFARDVTGTPGRHRHRPIRRDVETETRQPVALLVGTDLHPDDRVDALRPQPNDRSRRKGSVDVDVAGPSRAGERHEQLGRETRRRLSEVRVDALLPAVRPVGSQPQPLGALQDRDGLEVRRLEQDVGRRVGDLGILAAHDPRKRDGTLGIGDHEVARVEAARRAVERAELLALRARRTTTRSPRSRFRSNACSGFPSACIT